MTDRRSRRDFMGLTAGAVAGAIGTPWFSRTVAAAAGATAGDADLVITNANDLHGRLAHAHGRGAGGDERPIHGRRHER